jgi:hypothetical protein
MDMQEVRFRLVPVVLCGNSDLAYLVLIPKYRMHSHAGARERDNTA